MCSTMKPALQIILIKLLQHVIVENVLKALISSESFPIRCKRYTLYMYDCPFSFNALPIGGALSYGVCTGIKKNCRPVANAS
jgi:hypothetical protein